MRDSLKQMVLDEVHSWDADKMYEVFGAWLGVVVAKKKKEFILYLEAIWKDKKNLAFRETGELIPAQDFKEHFFDKKNLKKYNLGELEDLIKIIDNELFDTKDNEQ